MNKSSAGVSFDAPEGKVTVNGENHHIAKTGLIGQINTANQFDVVWTSEKPIEPDPFLKGYSGGTRTRLSPRSGRGCRRGTQPRHPDRTLKASMDALTTPFLTGTAIGAILFLAALGLTLTFGQMGVINMANGEFLMAGAYATYVTQQVVHRTGISILVAIPVAFVVTGLLGLLLEAAVIQWMYRRPLDTLLVTVGRVDGPPTARQGRLRRSGRSGPPADLDATAASTSSATPGPTASSSRSCWRSRRSAPSVRC